MVECSHFGFAEILLGYPTFIVPDPTDLISLVVLPFSWNLWRSMDQKRSMSLKPVQVFAFGLAVLGVMGTSPCVPPPEVQRIVVFEEVLYVNFEGYDPSYFSSIDYGRSWQKADNLTENIIEELQQPRPLPLQVCVPNNTEICYRITGAPYLEVSKRWWKNLES
ncbi:MAG: hypothetical protein HC806_06410 [Anaerolineae bacterium]|nr:hypothetical protein [Anaerolineae bacterium]